MHKQPGATSGTPAGSVDDLLALAFARKVLLELGGDLGPDALSGVNIGLLELWIRQPHPELDGSTAVVVFRMPGGSDRIRELLTQLWRAGAFEPLA